jgi:membrane-associated phospholipid phosphatase
MRPASIQIASRQHHRRWWQYALLAAIVLLALAPCDLPVARWCYKHQPSPPVFKAFEFVADIGGAGLGAILLLAAALILSRTNISRVPQFLSITVGGGLMADVIKTLIWRTRPHQTDLSIASFESTFHGLFPLFSAGSHGQSFPSGHAATAMGLAVALSILYPRGRWLFALIAVAVAASRVVVHAHFPTDVVAGLMLGGTSAFLLQRGFASRVFAWCERKIDSVMAERRRRRLASVDASCQSQAASTPLELNSDRDNRTAA